MIAQRLCRTPSPAAGFAPGERSVFEAVKRLSGARVEDALWFDG
jgi:hypothetical protein